MRLAYAGAEVPSHRKVLIEADVPLVALSFMGLSRRVKFARPWLLNTHFPDQMDILIDSGAYSVNREPEKYTQRELKEISTKYQKFVLENIDRITMVTEFDAMALGRDWIEQQREDFYSQIDESKFIPVWHPEWGVEYLTGMAQQFPRIGITAINLSGRDLAPLLNRMSSNGIKLHGVAMTQVNEMSSIKWDTVSSTSWVSPQQFGDTIVWTGRELKRYPKKYKEQARKRYRTLFEREGFDAQKIEDDDSTEVLRLSIWSWRQLVDSIERHAHPGLEVATNSAQTGDDPLTETGTTPVDNHPPETGKEITTREVVRTRETRPLPVIGVTVREEVDPDTGQTLERRDIRLRSESLLRCDTCFLASKCPAFEPAATCAYELPVEVKTKAQMVQLQNVLVEMQAQRVMFMRFAEQQEGGYADPNLSSEMDRLNKMIKTKHEMEQQGFSFKIEASSSGGDPQQGMLARIFGQKASDTAGALPGGPLQVESAVEIIDGEWEDSE